jgi:hypothetical protein
LILKDSKIFILNTFFILGNIGFISFAQNEINKTADTLSHHSDLSHHNSDLRHSVFGPPSRINGSFSCLL